MNSPESLIKANSPNMMYVDCKFIHVYVTQSRTAVCHLRCFSFDIQFSTSFNVTCVTLIIKIKNVINVNTTSASCLRWSYVISILVINVEGYEFENLTSEFSD